MIRVRSLNGIDPKEPRRGAAHVLYWMTAFRRTRANFALERAIDWARERRLPLVVLEALRCGHRWASERTHAFLLDGMRANAARFANAGVLHIPYVEREAGEGRGLLEALARRAAVVVTDDWPCFFVPRMAAAAAARLPIPVEAVDSNGLLPMRAADKVFPSAYAFRRFLQRSLREALGATPRPDPLARLDLPRAAAPRLRWPVGLDVDLGALPIDHAVAPAPLAGGEPAARARLRAFLDRKLARYPEERSDPDADGGSGLSPYLHFGHLSPHTVFAELARREGFDRDRLPARALGRREGFWGMRAAAEAFLDELVTWRELGFNFCSKREDYDEYESLPAWARATLDAHARDRRPRLYGLAAFEAAETHDPLWNAAQRQLRREGRIHNYLRMLWGKKILEWSESPREALRILIELNNRHALDGRDPNSYSGIFWTLGRYDRPWAPERPIFGVVRWMSSENTARKWHVKEYLKRHAAL